MTNCSRLLKVLSVPLLAAVLGGCGGLPGAPAPKETAPSTSPGASSLPVAPDAPQDSGRPATSQPTEPAMPPPVCEGGPFGCRTYQSVSGRDSSGELAWLQSQPLEVSTVFVNGTWTVGVKTPCNHLGIEVDVQGDQLLTTNIISTAMACLGPEGGYENWTHALFKQAVTWKLEGQSLVLQNAHGTVEFRDSGPNPNL